MTKRSRFFRKALRAAAALLILSAALAAGCGRQADKSAGDPLVMTFLKVGRADAIVLRQGDQTMVIDAGEEDDGEELVGFLKNKGVKAVDVLIMTHYDKDHVGGADTLVEEMKVRRILLPAYLSSGAEYRDFRRALSGLDIEPEELTEKKTFMFGTCRVTVEPPLSYENPAGLSDIDNDLSLITAVEHGKNRLLFTGDIEKMRIREYLAEGAVKPCALLKEPHHGVYNTALDELFKELRPSVSIICSSAKNPADTKTVELLKKYGSAVYETRYGDITVISDGRALDVSQ